ncbi:MAG TPA: mechanosensitive ion channel domain-containing protein [Stellaceae bacterium]|nr:mechanosensitive ion channel domain-containing protein [Stellaceae bacterium]
MKSALPVSILPACRRFWRAVSLALALGLSTVSQAVAATPAPAPSAAVPSAQQQTLTELQQLVGTLQDDAARKKLIDQLNALIAAQRGLKPPAPTPVGILESVSDHLQNMSQEFVQAAVIVIDVSRLWHWIEAVANDAAARARWIDASLSLAIALAAALIAETITRAVLRRVRRKPGERRDDRWPVRLAFAVMRLIVELLPLIAFGVAAFAALPLTRPQVSTSAVVISLFIATLNSRAILTLARVLLLRDGSIAPLLPIGEESAGYLYVWTRRFTLWLAYGYAAGQVAWWLGVPGGVNSLLLKAVALVVSALAIAFVLQNRQAVATWLRGRRDAAGTEPTRQRSAVRILRDRFADVWHVLAVLYIVALFAVYALRIEGGFIFVGRATLFTMAIVTVSRLLVAAINQIARRGFAIGDELKARFPSLETRANRYLPILTTTVTTVIYVFGALCLLEVWGVGSFSWLGTGIGRQLTGSLVTIGVVLLIAFLVWEVINAAIERYLTVAITGERTKRTARIRTLLPLLRNVFAVILWVLVGLLVLSELGVNIAPLLAGAGVVGLAIGFGSQALVKDLINGLFMLLEDTVAVGDVVDLGGGHTGVIEAISIRTIKLRDVAGAVHTMSFSEVTKVINLTKDFSYFVVETALTYDSDVDRALSVQRRVAEEMKADSGFGWMMLDEFETLGVDALGPTTVTLKGRIKTLPGRQWTIGREFNRRLKTALPAAGIPFPNTVAAPSLAQEFATILEKLHGADLAKAGQPAAAGQIKPPRKSKPA